MNNMITGLHHVTALTSDVQQNVDFYAGILGLRLVKKTINFDAPDVYHLYYGNETGDPGTILTFFPFQGMIKGKKGTGQLTVTSFSIPENSLAYWMKRLKKFNIIYQDPQERFQSEVFIYLEDPDGMGIELVANKTDMRNGFTCGNIPEEFAVKGFYGITINEDNYERTARLLTGQMDHRLVTEERYRYRFSSSDGYVDILHSPGFKRAVQGSGSVHHVAFATPNDLTQMEFREKLMHGGIVSPTPVIDRQYFHSVYFREPGGVLFEAATCDIGFTIDEPEKNLGENLKLPSWEEKNRSSIEKLLQPFKLETEKFKD
jgi:glyoxalase family protein